MAVETLRPHLDNKTFFLYKGAYPELGYNMCIHAEYLEKTLTENPYVLAIVYEGNLFQFEDFVNFVNSDMSGYIQKVKDRMTKLETENHKEE